MVHRKIDIRSLEGKLYTSNKLLYIVLCIGVIRAGEQSKGGQLKRGTAAGQLEKEDPCGWKKV